MSAVARATRRLGMPARLATASIIRCHVNALCPNPTRCGDRKVECSLGVTVLALDRRAHSQATLCAGPNRIHNPTKGDAQPPCFSGCITNKVALLHVWDLQAAHDHRQDQTKENFKRSSAHAPCLYLRDCQVRVRAAKREPQLKRWSRIRPWLCARSFAPWTPWLRHRVPMFSKSVGNRCHSRWALEPLVVAYGTRMIVSQFPLPIRVVPKHEFTRTLVLNAKTRGSSLQRLGISTPKRMANVDTRLQRLRLHDNPLCERNVLRAWLLPICGEVDVVESSKVGTISWRMARAKLGRGVYVCLPHGNWQHTDCDRCPFGEALLSLGDEIAVGATSRPIELELTV